MHNDTYLVWIIRAEQEQRKLGREKSKQQQQSGGGR